MLDGDTVQLLVEGLSASGGLLPGDRVRFRSIACPEKRRIDLGDRMNSALGVNPKAGCPGHEAANQLRSFTRGRDILVMPSGRNDRYGRMLADIGVFPSRGESDLSSVISLERVMVARGHAVRFGDERLPPLRPFGVSRDAEIPALGL